VKPSGARAVCDGVSTQPHRPGLPLLLFFSVVFGTTWVLQLPAILVQRGLLGVPLGPTMPLVVVGYFTPAIAALVLSRRDLGGGGVRALLAPFGAWRVSPGWALLALMHSGAVFVVAMSLARSFAGPGPGSLFYPPASAAQWAAMLVVPFTEQVPWRGFVYPRLARGLGPLGASLVTGAAWALFHVQKQSLIAPAIGSGAALCLLVLMIASTVVFTWFERRSGSTFLVVIANAGVYLDNPTLALPANVAPLAVDAVAYCALAASLVLLDRMSWRRSYARGLPAVV
jgi:membrane protease YdiL (CAAX protease family)